MIEQRSVLKGLLYSVGLLAFCAFIAYESRYHFDSALVEAKKDVHSAQRNWSVFFDQSNVYLSGGIRHSEDFSKLRLLIEPKSAIIADLASSYYMSAMLPIYVKNVHRHHGLYSLHPWGELISSRFTCYLEVPENLDKFKRVLKHEERRAAGRGVVPVRYIAVNKTHGNANFKRGCMSQRRGALFSVIDQLGSPVYEGETIIVYRLSSSTTSTQGH